ncbi:hypothetical protein E6C27_scaffold1770G00150 [Cucumis melo var. makuwa]|uniref:Uncharacterized protein n=1 Tax=Cucumis melo var. makuwa TaxID=1194695 RepID=A0A5A7TUF1_CUCMM|nr:hypothetical protein E6C27_scaffold1770G00150 [Cucumis melo var. makuwa]
MIPKDAHISLVILKDTMPIRFALTIENIRNSSHCPYQDSPGLGTNGHDLSGSVDQEIGLEIQLRLGGGSTQLGLVQIATRLGSARGSARFSSRLGSARGSTQLAARLGSARGSARLTAQPWLSSARSARLA